MRAPGWIVLIVLVTFFWGYLPVIIIHDYGGTIIILMWLVLLWNFSTNHVLKRVKEAGAISSTPA